MNIYRPKKSWPLLFEHQNIPYKSTDIAIYETETYPYLVFLLQLWHTKVLVSKYHHDLPPKCGNWKSFIPLQSVILPNMHKGLLTFCSGPLCMLGRMTLCRGMKFLQLPHFGERSWWYFETRTLVCHNCNKNTRYGYVSVS